MNKELAASGQLSAEQVEDWRESMRYIYSGSEYDNIDSLCDMALSSLRGTFADGIEAAAKSLEARKHLWRFPGQSVALQDAIDTVRALAQDQRESPEGRTEGSRSLGSNPVHGQSKTGLTGSHPGAPTQEADDLLRGLRRKLFRGGITAADWDVIDAYLARKEQ